MDTPLLVLAIHRIVHGESANIEELQMFKYGILLGRVKDLAKDLADQWTGNVS